MEFLDRIKERSTLRKTLGLNREVLVVIYGRRRVDKSELIKKVLTRTDIYHLSEEAQLQQQIDSFAKTVSFTLEGFNRVSYPDWETVCLDTFSYLVKSDASLPSVIQRLIDNYSLKYNLILYESSQRMMHSLVLNDRSPLY